MLEDLRLLILIIAVVGFAFLIFDSMRRRLKKNSHASEFEQTVFGSHHEQAQNKESYDPLFDDLESSPQNLKSDIKPATVSQKIKPSLSKTVQEVLTIAITARHKGGFSGRALEAALKGHRFYYGKKGIFHRHLEDNPENCILYSVAQSTEPGIFDLATIKHQRIPGIVIFMVLPLESENPLSVLEQMLKGSRQLAAGLNGELCDSQHSHLTTQTIEHFREKIQEHHRKMLAVQQNDG